MRPRESPLPVFSEVKGILSCFGGAQNELCFCNMLFYNSIVWRLNSREFLCPSSAELEFVSSKQVNDMRVHESPLPSTNTRAKEDWLQINGLLNLVNPGNPFHIS